MNQEEIRDYNGQQYTVSEGAALVKELNDRTKSAQTGYNSIDELATKVQEIVVGSETTTIENEYADIAAMLLDQANQTQGAIQFVADASADPNIANGYAYYEYLGLLAGALTDYRLLSQEEVNVIETGVQKVSSQNGNEFDTGLKVMYGAGFIINLIPGGGYKVDLDNQSSNYKIVSCVLRQDSQGSGWYAIDNAGHKPIGVSGVREVNGEIVIDYDFTSVKIGSLLAVFDETYARTPLTVGASVGSTSASLSLYHPFEARISGTGVSVQNYLGTRGIEWDCVVDVNAGTYTFTHPSMMHSDSNGYPVTATIRQEGNIDAVSVSSMLKTGFTLTACQNISGKSNGASILSTNAVKPTYVWDGIDTMTITHSKASNAYSFSVMALNPSYLAVVTGSNQTTLTVKFTDLTTGLIYTGASKPCNFYFNRNSMTASKIVSGTKIYTRRGLVKCDSKNIASSNGNIWIYGIFEV